MPKQLNVNLSFTADTQQAKAQLQDLQSQLTKITANAGNSPLGLTQEISAAVVETTKLQTALQKATTSTGSLDLGAFRQELQKADLSAEKVASTLMSLGPEGQAAFAQLAQSISLAEVPIRRTNGLLTEFATTLKNTARWQISSSILHGFMGSLQSAYGYAQDLNESLTNIRIVTGQSTEQMADFAKQANKAAKELSTTTTAYTDAALIFYQQGLTGDDVTERTDTVIKMANVTGDSAEEVSSYMTAIWNNYADGSETLEHYADVITALGASTASSSAEIAAGLEKFASVGETIGLTYDYATSALATIVATTRQSADSVGTGLRTIFTRLQGLKLGETLDDGTDLNKYSQALASVGVNIKTVDGQLKDMDTILDELGARWGQLSKDQQVALAQTVAGVRQYVNLVALMDNWDFMQDNVEIAREAEGSLQEQADRYAESWEAASKRVKAATQGIYQQLLDDNFFIDLTNGVATVTESIGNIIDALGGLKGVLPLISSLLLKTFGSDIAKSMDNFAYNIKLGTQAGRQAIIEERQQWNEELIKMADNGMVSGSAQVDIYREQANVQNDLIAKTMELQSKNKDITSEEEMQLNYLMDINARMGEEYALATQNLEELKAQTTELENQVFTDSFSSAKVGGKDVNADSDEWNNEIAKIEQIQSLLGEATALKNEFVNLNTADGQQALQGIIDKLENYQSISDAAEEETRELREALESLRTSTPADLDKNIKNVNQSILNLQKNSKKSFNDLISSIEGTDEETKQLVRDLKALADAKFKEGAASTQAAKAENNHAASVDNLKKRISELEGTVVSTSQRLVAMGSGLSSFAMMLSSIRGVIDTINNPDLSGWEKFVAILGSVGMTITMSLSAMKQLHTALGAEATVLGVLNAQHAANVAIRGTDVKSRIMLITLMHQGAVEKTKDAILNKILADTEIKLNGVIVKNVKSLSAEQKALLLQMYATEADTAAIEGATIAQNAFNASLLANPLTWIVVALVAATAAVVGYAEACKKAREEQIENANKAIEENNAKEQEVNKNKELIDSYHSLVDAYNEGNATRADVANGVEELCEKYDLEDGRILALTGRYEELTDAIREKRKAELESSSEIANDSIDEALKSAQATAATGFQKTTKIASFTYGGDSVVNGNEDGFWQTLANNYARSAMYQAAGNMAMSDAVLGTDHASELIEDASTPAFELQGDVSTAKGLLEYYNKLIEAKKKYKEEDNSEAVSAINKEIEQYQEEVDTILAQIDILGKNVAETGFLDAEKLFGSVDNYKDFSNTYDNIINNVKSTLDEALGTGAITKDQYNKSLSNAKNYLAELLSQYDNAYQYLANKDYIESLISSKGWEDRREELESKIGELSDDALTIAVGLSIDNPDDFLNNIDYYIARAQAIAEGQDVEVKMASVKDVESSLNSDKKLTNKQQEALQDNFNALGMNQSWAEFDAMDRIDQMEVLSQLSDELIEKNNEYIKGLEETAKQAQAEKEADEARVEELTKRLAELKKSQEDFGEADGTESWIGTYDRITSEIKEIDEELEELSNKEYNIDIDLEFVDDAIFDNFETKVDSILSEAEALKTAAELIGEGWQVAAEDAKKLADVYPELMEGAEVLADGVIQLNQDKVNTILAGNSEIIAADKETAASQLESQIALLDAEIEYQQTKLEILQNLLEGKINETDAEKALQEAESKFEEQCIDAVGEADANATNQEVANHIAATDVNLKNLDIIDQRIAEISQHYSKMLSGEIVTASTSSGAVGGGTATYSGGDYTTNITDNDLTNTTVDEIKAQIQATQDTLDALQDQRADYTALLSELRAGTDDAVKAMDRVQSGKAGKEDKKKSGGGKKKETKDEKKQDDEFDRYHDINEALKDLDHTMKMLSKEQEHLFGNELAASLREENALLDQQTGLYEQKLAMQQQEQAELQAELATNGVAFDAASGQMINYAEATAQALKELNDAIKAYNASAQEEADKLVLEAAQKKYDLFKKNLERYDSLLQEIRTSQENIQDNYYKKLENELKAWNAEIQVKLDLAEAKRTWHEFINKISKDFKSVFRDVSKDMASIVKQAETFMGNDGTIAVNIGAANEIMREIDNMQNGGTSNKFASVSEAQEELKKYNDQLQDAAEELYQLYEDAWDAYIEGIDQAIEKFDDLIDQYERINDDLDHQAKIIELLYGDKAFDYLSQLYGAQANNLLGEMDSLRQQIDFYQSQYQHAVAEYGADSEAAQKWKDSWEGAIDELHSKEEDYIEAIQNQALNTIDEVFDALERKMTGGDSLDWVNQQWEDALKAAEGYYDEVERIYQLESMEQKWRKAINNTSSLKNQQQLKAIMDDQLSALENKTKLSEYDIELAEKRLAVYQAQIALEDAQNNKTSMKLTRDASGNWSYQYVADEDDIASKQEDLLAKQQEYYEFTKQSWQDLTQTIIDDTQTALERIRELEEESLSATTERQAEIAEQIEYLREYYWGEEGVITQEIANQAEYEDNLNQATAETLWALYETDVENYELMTEAEQALIDQLRDYGVTNFQTLYDAIANNYDDIQKKCDDINAQSLNTWTTTANEMIRKWNSGDGDSIVFQVTQALNTCSQAVAQYAYMVQQGCIAAGENFANVGYMIQMDQAATAALEGQTQQLVGTTCSLLAQYESYLAQVANMWNAVAGQIYQATAAIQQYLALQGIATSISAPGSGNGGGGVGAKPTGGNPSNGDSGKKTGTLDNDTAWGIATAIWTEGDNGWYNNPIRSKELTEKFGDGAYQQVQDIINQHSANGDLYNYWKKNLGGDASQYHYSAFATGGYTGDWDGGDGRLAVLHSKELVLNKEDTQNMLAAVDSVRQIAGLGNSITSSIASGIGKMIASLTGLGNSHKYETYNTDTTGNNTNTFEITMNVDGGDVQEIQQAILNLPNLASQFLSKNNR